jgi:hypothetical protein
MKKNIFFASLKSLKKGDGSGVGGTDPRIRIQLRIRTKMSRITNTGYQYLALNMDTKIKNAFFKAGFVFGGLMASYRAYKSFTEVSE